MENEKIILLFSDLEGTILRESDGQYSDEDMYLFLQQLDELQKNTNAKVKIHLVSPVYMHQMKQFIEKIDMNIYSYNRIHKEFGRISTIECAGAYPDDEIIEDKYAGQKIIPLKKPINRNDFDTARFGKANYVKNWIDMYNENSSKELLMSIYCGNGRNDLDAMSYIKKGSKGFVICPKNSRHQAQELAFYTSEKEDLPGIIEGIYEINKRILEKNEHKKNGQMDKQDNSQR